MKAAAGLILAAALTGSTLEQPGGVFRARTVVTEMEVDVRRPDGTPVADLTSADFEVLEDGEVQTLINIEALTPLTLAGDAALTTVAPAEVSLSRVTNTRP
ncbi:MAG TPA: hypothetical protein VMF13_18765, partial [Luteitalea sp.]|nr:hypothetical protein [Luteitalea sp.]